jgi:DNA-binding MarR family transcriptional regulator
MISKPAVSRMVMNLEKKDLISRKRSETDARVIELQVTDKGHEIIKAVSDVYRRRTEQLRERIGTEEFDHFIELMDQANSIIAEELGIQQ